jgi:hypothetical protein
MRLVIIHISENCVGSSFPLLNMEYIYLFSDTVNTGCPTSYRTRHFFNNSNTNEDIATKFEQEYVRCWEMKRNVSVVCVCNAPNCCDTEQQSASQPGSVASGTPYIITFENHIKIYREEIEWKSEEWSHLAQDIKIMKQDNEGDVTLDSIRCRHFLHRTAHCWLLKKN